VFDPDGGSHLGHRGTASDITDPSERALDPGSEGGPSRPATQDQFSPT
jgi:hypothetical protein